MKTYYFKIQMRCKTNFNSTINVSSEHSDTIFGLSHCFSTLLNTASKRLEICETFEKIEYTVDIIKN